MRFYRRRGDEETIRNFPIRETGGDKLENLVFAFRDPEFCYRGGVTLEWAEHLDLDDLWPREPKARPNAEAGKHHRYAPDVALERHCVDQELIFDELQKAQECGHRETVDNDGAAHATNKKKATGGTADGLEWRRRQDSNLWYPFGVQRFSKPPLSAAQPRLLLSRKLAKDKVSFSVAGQTFVKPQGILRTSISPFNA